MPGALCWVGVRSHRASSPEIKLQAFDHKMLHATPSRGSRGSLGQNLETFQHPLTAVFLECDRFQSTTGNRTRASSLECMGSLLA